MDSAPSMESRFRLMGRHARISRREQLFRERPHPKHIRRHGLSPFRWGHGLVGGELLGECGGCRGGWGVDGDGRFLL